MDGMDRSQGIFVDGIGAAAATSGVLSQLQGRIFGVLYLAEQPLALEGIAATLGQSKSNVSVNIRGLVEWHLVRRVMVPGSRKDHYEATADFLRAVQEVVERRFRWCVRQVIAAAGEAERTLDTTKVPAETARFRRTRLGRLQAFFTAMDAGFGAFTQGRPLDPATLGNVVALVARPRR